MLLSSSKITVVYLFVCLSYGLKGLEGLKDVITECPTPNCAYPNEAILKISLASWSCAMFECVPVDACDQIQDITYRILRRVGEMPVIMCAATNSPQTIRR